MVLSRGEMTTRPVLRRVPSECPRCLVGKSCIPCGIPPRRKVVVYSYSLREQLLVNPNSQGPYRDSD